MEKKKNKKKRVKLTSNSSGLPEKRRVSKKLSNPMMVCSRIRGKGLIHASD